MSFIKTRPIIRLLRLEKYPLLDQLILEEALFRSHPENWFVLNDGVLEPSIVLGISGKIHELVNVPEAASKDVTIIRRFTGGGTVVVDSDSILTSVIVDGPKSVPDVQPYPKPIMAWTEKLFHSVFQKYMGEFSLRENDYVLGHMKFGGNAQAISRGRWLHHTSFLWDYSPEHMNLLLNPQKAPEYRFGREHKDFLVRLRDVVPSRDKLIEELCGCLESSSGGFDVLPGRLEEGLDVIGKNKIVGSKLVPLE